MAKNEWWTAPAEADNGNLVIVTGRDCLAKEIESGKYDFRVEVTLNYEAVSGGMPDKESSVLMERVTDALSEELSREKAVIMTGIYTGDGKREWIFYTKNLRIFSSVFNRALAGLPVIPFEINAYSDPEWEEYRLMKDMTYILPED